MRRVALLLALLTAAWMWCFELVKVPSDAMRPGLAAGDWVLIDELTPGAFEPEVGDIVLLKDPGHDAPVIARVVALGGSRVSWRGDGHLEVDGEVVPMKGPEPEWKAARMDVEEVRRAKLKRGELEHEAVLAGVRHRVLTRSDSLYRHEPGEEVEVPPGHLFVLGDHRDAAFDSRRFGAVPASRVTGQVRLLVRGEPERAWFGAWLGLP